MNVECRVIFLARRRQTLGKMLPGERKYYGRNWCHYSHLYRHHYHVRLVSKARAVLSKKELKSLICFSMPPSLLLLLTSLATRLRTSSMPVNSTFPWLAVFAFPCSTTISRSWIVLLRASRSCKYEPPENKKDLHMEVYLPEHLASRSRAWSWSHPCEGRPALVLHEHAISLHEVLISFFAHLELVFLAQRCCRD